MKVAIVSSSDLGDRWDAKFHCLVAEHKEVYQELFLNFTIDELVAFAKSLPFDQEAADAVFPTVSSQSKSKLTAILDNTLKPTYAKYEWRWDDSTGKDEWTGVPGTEKPLVVPRRRHRDICAYAAAAAHGSVRKLMNEILELRRSELAKIKHAAIVIKLARDKKCTKLVDVLAPGYAVSRGETE